MTIEQFNKAERIINRIDKLESELKKWNDSNGFERVLLTQPVGKVPEDISIGYLSFNSIKVDTIKKIEMRIKQEKNELEAL